MKFDFFRRLSLKGGTRMDADVYWELFCATGDPVAYMLYRAEEQPEDGEVQ